MRARSRRLACALVGVLLTGTVTAGSAAATSGSSLVPLAKLTPSDGTTNTHMGMSVAMDADVVVAGAPGASSGTGAVYVFRRAIGGWADDVQIAKLTASDGASNVGFGQSVAIQGDTIVVGAPGHTSGRGAVYVFHMPAEGWVDATETAVLTASDALTDDVLGASVAVNGSTISAGAPASSALRPGAVYVFERPSGGWATGTQSAKLTASDAVTTDKLGHSVAMTSDVIVAGAIGDDTDSIFSHGSVYVFQRGSSGWVTATQTAKLTASDGAAFDELGSSVAISGDVVVAGAPCRDRVDSASNSCQASFETDEGALYVFQKAASGWANGTQTARLDSSSSSTKVALGSAVAIEGDVVVGGAPIGPAAPSARVFVRPASGWADMTETQTLETTVVGESQLGRSVATGDGVVVVGVGDLQNVGSLTVFGPPADSSAPTTTIELTPSSSDGANGWYVASPSATVTASDGSDGSGVADTRCVLDPGEAPSTFEQLPDACDFSSATAITGDGTHTLYAASVDEAGHAGTPVSATVAIDATDPTVTCNAAPTFSLRGAGGPVTASVGDDTSGPADETVSTAADVNAVGRHTSAVIGSDLAGHIAGASCDYLVAYVVRIDSLTAGSKGKAGSSIQTRFALTDAGGGVIAAGEAQSISSSCRATVRFENNARVCATYRSSKGGVGAFDATLRLAKSPTPGSHTVWVEVLVGTDYVNAVATTVITR